MQPSVFSLLVTVMVLALSALPAAASVALTTISASEVTSVRSSSTSAAARC